MWGAGQLLPGPPSRQSGPGGGALLALAASRVLLRRADAYPCPRAPHRAAPPLHADGQGSVSPTQPMPYAFAMATGLTAAGLRIAADKAIEGRSMAGCGFRDTAQVGTRAWCSVHSAPAGGAGAAAGRGRSQLCALSAAGAARGGSVAMARV